MSEYEREGAPAVTDEVDLARGLFDASDELAAPAPAAPAWTGPTREEWEAFRDQADYVTEQLSEFVGLADEYADDGGYDFEPQEPGSLAEQLMQPPDEETEREERLAALEQREAQATLDDQKIREAVRDDWRFEARRQGLGHVDVDQAIDLACGELEKALRLARAEGIPEHEFFAEFQKRDGPRTLQELVFGAMRSRGVIDRLTEGGISEETERALLAQGHSRSPQRRPRIGSGQVGRER